MALSLSYPINRGGFVETTAKNRDGKEFAELPFEKQIWLHENGQCSDAMFGEDGRLNSCLNIIVRIVTACRTYLQSHPLTVLHWFG